MSKNLCSRKIPKPENALLAPISQLVGTHSFYQFYQSLNFYRQMNNLSKGGESIIANNHINADRLLQSTNTLGGHSFFIESNH